MAATGSVKEQNLLNLGCDRSRNREQISKQSNYTEMITQSQSCSLIMLDDFRWNDHAKIYMENGLCYMVHNGYMVCTVTRRRRIRVDEFGKR